MKNEGFEVLKPQILLENVMYIPKQVVGIERIKIGNCLLKAKIHKVVQGIKTYQNHHLRNRVLVKHSPSTSNQERKIKTKTKLTNVKGELGSWRKVERLDLSNAVVVMRQQ